MVQYINNVIKELYHLIPAKPYISDLRANLEEYVQQFPNSTYSDLVEQFGTPEIVAKEFIETEKPYGPKERSKYQKRNRWFIILTIGIIAVLVWLVLSLAGAQILHYSDTTYIEENGETIE